MENAQSARESALLQSFMTRVEAMQAHLAASRQAEAEGREPPPAPAWPSTDEEWADFHRLAVKILERQRS